MSTTDLSAFDRSKVPSGTGFRIAIAVSNWNDEITENLYRGAFDTLTEFGVKYENITRYDVPGSFELIYAASALQNTGRYDAIIVLGCVIRGETPHFEYICSSVAQNIGLLNVQAGEKNTAPVVFGVLTDNHIEQSRQRSGGLLGNKGVECAVDALRLAALRTEVSATGNPK